MVQAGTESVPYHDFEGGWDMGRPSGPKRCQGTRPGVTSNYHLLLNQWWGLKMVTLTTDQDSLPEVVSISSMHTTHSEIRHSTWQQEALLVASTSFNREWHTTNISLLLMDLVCAYRCLIMDFSCILKRGTCGFRTSNDSSF